MKFRKTQCKIRNRMEWGLAFPIMCLSRIHALRKGLFIFIILVGSMSCVKEIPLSNRLGERKLVVEGMLTNDSIPYTIKLSYLFELDNYIGIGEIPYAENANVKISDDQGHSTQMEYLSNGLYQTSDTSFVGVIGRSYSLSIETLEGKKFISLPEKLLPAVQIDSAYTDLIFHGPAFAEGYDVYVDFKDPPGEENYYRWTGFSYSVIRSICPPCSGLCPTCYEYCWKRNDDRSLNISSDQLFDGREVKGKRILFSPAYVNNAHLVEIQQFSMTKRAYEFWQQYKDQQSRVGSIFDPAPASIKGNIVSADSSIAQLGYFFVSGVSHKRFSFVDTVLQNVPSIYGVNELPRGSCDEVYPMSSLVRPTGW